MPTPARTALGEDRAPLSREASAARARTPAAGRTSPPGARPGGARCTGTASDRPRRCRWPGGRRTDSARSTRPPRRAGSPATGSARAAARLRSRARASRRSGTASARAGAIHRGVPSPSEVPERAGDQNAPRPAGRRLACEGRKPAKEVLRCRSRKVSPLPRSRFAAMPARRSRSRPFEGSRSSSSSIPRTTRPLPYCSSGRAALDSPTRLGSRPRVDHDLAVRVAHRVVAKDHQRVERCLLRRRPRKQMDA